MKIIAEVKTHSPFGWQSTESWDELFSIAKQFGDIISIHTDPRWNGSMQLISKARKLTNKPILAKGIHANDADIEEALKLGADYVLVVGRIPFLHFEQCFIEPTSLNQLKTLPPSTKVVWNSRDLSTGGLKTETFKEARALFSGWLVQASNIKSYQDIELTADAVLIGTHLVDIARDEHFKAAL
jgi:indole-3-glycerol phosphate synthase